jgi:mannose-1-phosphate guanylyltransferase
VLADVFRHHVLVQPCNRGTAVGVAFALLTIATRDDPGASVVLLPSDHYVADEERLRQAVTTALGAVAASGRAVHLLGITPDAPDADYGWLVPSCRDVVADVARFVEKPPLDAVRPLIADGALINSFVLVARVNALLRVIGRAVPRLLAALRACLGEPAGEPDLAQAYGALPVTDLSRDVLERRPQDLRVVRVAPCGWSDLGTPARIQPFLVGHHSAA